MRTSSGSMFGKVGKEGHGGLDLYGKQKPIIQDTSSLMSDKIGPFGKMNNVTKLAMCVMKCTKDIKVFIVSN